MISAICSDPGECRPVGSFQARKSARAAAVKPAQAGASGAARPARPAVNWTGAALIASVGR